MNKSDKSTKPANNLSPEERSKTIRKSYEKLVQKNGKALEKLSEN